MRRIAESRISGHFSSLFKADGNTIVATSMTTQRKSKSREKEQAKRSLLLSQLKDILGSEVDVVSRSIDGVGRRWNNVKEIRHD